MNSADEYDEEFDYHEERIEGECNVIGIELRGFLTIYHANEEIDENGNPIFDQSASEKT